ncbi:MAG: hypothetical protein QXD48_03620 [Candidatus Aenigmatarchaeota archaeon]
MKSKNIRNLILTLIIVIIGIKIIIFIFQNHLSRFEVVNIATDIINFVFKIGELIIYGLIFLIIILIPIYFSKRSDEKEIKRV